MLKTSTDGIRATFSGASKSAQKWMELSTSASGEQPSENLREMHSALTLLVREGEEQLAQILRSFGHKGDEIATELAERLVAVRTLLIKHQSECSTWFCQEVERWRTSFERAGELHDEEHYGKAARLLDAIEQRIRRRCAESMELAKQQQSRDYLLKAVRQVCCNMGMREIEPPRLERPNEAGSRILLTVASADKGKLRFALTLDGIQSIGEATECTKDLRQISELLSDGFDVRTKFRSVTDDDPQLRRPTPATSAKR